MTKVEQSLENDTNSTRMSLMVMKNLAKNEFMMEEEENMFLKESGLKRILTNISKESEKTRQKTSMKSGTRLQKDLVFILILKPCHLKDLEEKCTEETMVEEVIMFLIAIKTQMLQFELETIDLKLHQLCLLFQWIEEQYQSLMAKEEEPQHQLH